MTPDRISCGGVVYRTREKQVEVLLLHRYKTDSWNYDSWHLPKGMKLPNESLKETALREVVEETGYSVKVIKKIGELSSTYDDKSGKGNKLTYYFLLEPIKETTKPDTEHDEVVWVDLDKAIDFVSKFPIWEKEEEILIDFKKEIQ